MKVPAGLRGAGLNVITLAEHYGMPEDEKVDDVTWLTESAERGWVAVMKDARIRRRPVERAAVKAAGARCFYFTRADLRAELYVERFLTNLHRIATACEDPGPFMYVVHAHAIERMD